METNPIKHKLTYQTDYDYGYQHRTDIKDIYLLT